MKKTIALLLSILPIFAFGQKVDLSQFEKLKIRNIGPAGMSGRVTAIAVDLSDSDHIYVGTASGGLWESQNGGVSWNPVFDDQPTQSIGSIHIHQANPSIIWVGTGEGNPRNSHNSGAGIFKSIDGGKTWKCMGLENSKIIHRVLVHPDNPDIVYAGVMGSAWGPNEMRGVYKSTDGGLSWARILYQNDKTGIAELRMDPVNPNKLIAAMWEFGRTPWDFDSGGEGSGLFVTFDGGENWERKTADDGLPKGKLGRMGIAISPANPKVVYALVEAKENALYKSTDGGDTFRKISTHDNIGNRPFYYYEIYPDPKNEHKLYSLYSYVSVSEDGGRTFRVIADYGNAVHPDHHAFWIHPDDPTYLIDGNDGGMNISRDGGNSWLFINNLPVGQFYHVNVDDAFPYNVYGGMQDNGSWAGPGFVLKSGGIRNADWQEVMFGDGFDVAPKPGNNRYGYAMSQGGNLGYFDRETGITEFIRPVHPEGTELRFNWNAALALDPFDDCGLYYGSQFVHKSNDCGRSWTIISPDLTTNDSLKQKQDKSGGLTIDATGAENHTTILAIEPSPADDQVIWVGTDDGNLQLTTDGGESWTNLISKIATAPDNSWIPQIRASADNPGEALVVLNNYRQNDWSAHLYQTRDYGQSWTRLVDDEQVGGFVCAVLQDPGEPNLIFLGTDIGLYVSFDGGSVWNHWKKGFPAVQIRDLAYQKEFDDLVIGTFGRAFWVLDNISPLREIASSGGSILEKPFAVIDPPPAYRVGSRSYDGVRFVAQGEFIGDNKDLDAGFTIWLKPVKEGKKEEKEKTEDDNQETADALKRKGKKDQLYVSIINEPGDTIREYDRELKDTGMVRVFWNLREDGVRFPSRRSAREDASLPSGIYAKPGTYKTVFTWNGHKDSSEVEVRLDPRVQLSDSEIEAQASAMNDLEQLIEKAAKAFNFLRESRESVELVEKMAVNLPDSTSRELKKMNKDQKKKLDELESLYMMEDGLKGIQRDPGRLNSLLSGSRRYLNAGWGTPSENAMTAYQHAKRETEEVISQINEYMDSSWKEYQDFVNVLDFNPFKKVEKVGME